MKKKKWITDVISKEEVEKWEPGNVVLISAPMGAGKSYFCKNPLYDIANEKNGRILMLIHRSNCVDQFKYELETAKKTDVIDVVTYQSLEYGKLHNLKNQINLSLYHYIISDEFHYFFNDSSFNNKTAVSFQMIMSNTSAVRIFMSATGEYMARYIRKYLQMATGDDYDTVKNLMRQYNDLGQELGAITTDVASGADAWLRQGKSLEQRVSCLIFKVNYLIPMESKQMELIWLMASWMSRSRRCNNSRSKMRKAG